MNGDLWLVGRILKNDRDAANELVQKYYDEIYAFAYRQTSDKQTAMDLTQEIFVSMLSGLRHYDAKKAGLRTWLYRIASNKIVDHFRSRASKRDLPLDPEEFDFADETDFVRNLEARELLEKVLDRVNGLDADTQRIFRLKIFGEHTFSEIASFMSIPESSVKSVYYRLIHRLKDEFRHGLE